MLLQRDLEGGGVLEIVFGDEDAKVENALEFMAEVHLQSLYLHGSHLLF